MCDLFFAIIDPKPMKQKDFKLLIDLFFFTASTEPLPLKIKDANMMIELFFLNKAVVTTNDFNTINNTFIGNFSKSKQ